MQERVNKHKPIIKKEVIENGNIGQQSQFTQYSKVSSNSQNKPFIRKPVSNTKRQPFASPTYTKNYVIQNAQSNSPLNESKSRQSMKLDSQSDMDYSEGQQISPQCNTNINIAFKRHISNQQNLLSSNTLLDNSQAIKQAYYGNGMCSLTEIGQNYKVQTGELLNSSERDIYFGEKMKNHNVKQNIALKHLNSITKKTTRTEYFTNNNTINSDQSKSITTSRSLKQKQINFKQLKTSANNSVQAYIKSLQQNIRKLQKTTYTLNKKCKWMHEQVEMHLEKQNTMTKQNQLLTISVKEKQKCLKQIKRQLQLVKLQLAKVKSQKKQSLVRYKSFKEIETISSLRELSTKKDQYSKVENKKATQKEDDDGYFANTSLSSEKNKKFSFKTYPGVRSPRNRKQDMSKFSSIAGNNESYQSENYLGETSILDNKSCLKQQISLERTQMLCKQLERQRDLLKVQLDRMKEQFVKINEEHALKLSENTKHYEHKMTILQTEIENYKKQQLQLKQRNTSLQMELDKILVAHQQQVQTLNFKIKQLQGQIQNSNNIIGNSKRSLTFSQSSKDIKDFQFHNPLQYLLQHPDQSVSTDQQHNEHHFEQQNKSLRKYIQQMLQHYKYIKIENRMLLKLKEDLQKCDKQKKQIKQERDMFKKKLLDTLKNSNKNLLKNNNSKRSMQYESDEQQEDDDDESQSEISAVLELSSSSIICHPQSEIVQQ